MSGGVLGLHAWRQPIRVGHWQPQYVEQKRTKHRVKPLDPADADAPQRVAVISPVERDEEPLRRLWISPLPPVLEGHFERYCDGRRPVVGKKDMGDAGWRESDEPFGQLDRRR